MLGLKYNEYNWTLLAAVQFLRKLGIMFANLFALRQLSYCYPDVRLTYLCTNFADVQQKLVLFDLVINLYL